ncbi:PRC-barrel domain containing protein [Halanaerobium kushneri]|uniref:PRC-barrel domain-containing protein n=1 Tax=Halanaerobium kushneri TaxID=56779 RepID=A0A1N6RHI8_9FIRM|nr:PRC-barrel domain-containing protein [Halanaerobium kushneri]SIQ28281.1 PRC-barrel domain-containing protein [Halanaerobium kushneri]
MLRKLKNLEGFTVQGRDEKLGKTKDFYFDQHRFVLRYLVIDTGNWLKHEKTLISTDSFEEINYDNQEIIVNLTAEDLEAGPSIQKNKPVSRVMEEKVVKHFDWPIYWTSSHPADGPAIQAGSIIREKLFNFENLTDEEKQAKEKEIESNLRSFNEIRGYHIQAQDKEFGHLEDLFVDEENWVIRYLLIDTRNILPGKDVLIAPEWLQNISWNKEKLYVSKTREEIKNAPEYREESSDYLVDRRYEEKLYNHYDEIKYWQQ